MNYINKNMIKNKNLIKKGITYCIKTFKFKSLNLSLNKQIVILWSLIWYISLFMPWIIDNEKWLSWNSFNSLTWNIWFLLVIILSLPIFIILSTNYKEKIKLYSDLSIKNHFIIITSWIFILSFSIITLSFVNWLNTFFENTIYWKGVILSMTSWIILLISGLLIRREYYSDNSEIILNNFNLNKEKIKEEDNMKLPF